MIGILVLTIVSVTALLVGWAFRRNGGDVRDAVCPEYRVLSSDLLGRGTALHDDEWGISGKIDLLLQGPHGELVPVEYKPAWKGYEPGTTRASHVVQLALYFILCEGDRRLRRAPAEGRIRYIDEHGRVVPGGEVRIRNSPQARLQALAIVERVRRAKRSGAEVHRTHHSPYNCRKCADRSRCGEAKG